MKLRTVLVFLMLAAVSVFALINWAAFTAPTALSLGFYEFQAPLGLVMLVLTGAVSGVLLVYILMQQAGVIMEARRYAKELTAHRELADKAEASRFTELRAFLETELRRIEAQNVAGTRELGARIDQLQQVTRY
ncbi:MAG: LapA family protein [Chitinophagaceae bacterium]|nr:LapA family protein [Rubrivivax sp.]